MSEPLIKAFSLHKSFGNNHAVNDVSLQVSAGEIFGLVGPDGAGKTTIVRLLCGALRLDAGQVYLNGLDITHHTEQARAGIGYLAQRFSLYEDLTVLENLRFFAEVRGIITSEWIPRSQEILDFVGLSEFEDRRAGQLSGGMKQKLGLALALVNRPQILLLDEPTTGVDPVTRQDFWRLIIRLLGEEDLAVLVSTPYMDEAMRCMRVGFLRNGKLVCEGAPADLCARLNQRVLEIAAFPQHLLISLAKSDPNIEKVQRFGNRYHLRVKPGYAQTVLQTLPQKISSAGGTVDTLQIIDPQLEDVFIDLSESLE